VLLYIILSQGHWPKIYKPYLGAIFYTHSQPQPQINASDRFETPWKRKITAPHAAATSLCRRRGGDSKLLVVILTTMQHHVGKVAFCSTIHTLFPLPLHSKRH